MPHLTIELSADIAVDEPKLLQAANQVLIDSGVFTQAHDIKSRVYRPLLSLVGDGMTTQGFIYVCLKIMPGRTDAIKDKLAQSLLTALQSVLDSMNDKLQYGVEVLDLSVHYIKA